MVSKTTSRGSNPCTEATELYGEDMDRTAAATAIVGSAEFMVGALLICIGISIIAGTIILLNRLFAKYWVPVKIFSYVNVMNDSKNKSFKEPRL
jgi:hypothetical protein